MPAVLALLLALCLLAGCGGSGADERTGSSRLTGLSDVADLRGPFNERTGVPRVILFLSPTWGVCLAGARRVQSDILEKHASADLQVYVVWMPMLPTDARSKWDPEYLSDHRVRHFWDEGRTAGLWFARAGVGGLGYAGVVWDAYLLFGPEASWDDKPGPLEGAGAPVVAKSAQLKTELGRLVAE